MAHVLKNLTDLDPFTVFAPTMTERLTPEEEDPLYRYATGRGWVTEPVIFEHREQGHVLGSDAFDAYLFFPRTRLIGGHPDWMMTTLGRKPVAIPEEIHRERGPRLVQAFRAGPPHMISQDQVVSDGGESTPVLTLPPGLYWVRSIGRDGNPSPHLSIEVR